MVRQIEYGRCPLCHQDFPMADLEVHAKRESDEIKKYTLEIIKAQHPDWVKENGACPKCWDYYKKL